MGVFKIRVTIAGARREPVEAVVDTGAPLAVLPARMLRELGFSPEFRQRFQLADGREQEREVGPAKLAIDGVEATVPVVFGSPGDGVLIGATTLEVMGFAADPVAKKLVRTPAYMLESHRERPPSIPFSTPPGGELKWRYANSRRATGSNRRRWERARRGKSRFRPGAPAARGRRTPR